MTPANPSNSAKPKNPSMRPLTLASVVSFVIAVAVVAIAGPLSYRALISSSLISSVQAADGVQPTSGFADLVAKVKPAVISVRVRIEQSTDTNGMGQSEGNNPFPPGSPMEKILPAIRHARNAERNAAEQAIDHRTGLGLLHFGGWIRGDQ